MALIRKQRKSLIISDVRVRNSYFNSDHRLLVTKFKTPANKAARHFIRSKSSGKSPRVDVDALKLQESKKLFINTIEMSITSKEKVALTINEQHSQITPALKSARETLPRRPKREKYSHGIMILSFKVLLHK